MLPMLILVNIPFGPISIPPVYLYQGLPTDRSCAENSNLIQNKGTKTYFAFLSGFSFWLYIHELVRRTFVKKLPSAYRKFH